MNKLINTKIDSKHKCEHLLLLLHKLINDGDIKQVWPSDSPFASEESVLLISPVGPWPDYMEMYFKALETKKSYKLTIETFHGTGGELVEY